MRKKHDDEVLRSLEMLIRIIDYGFESPKQLRKVIKNARIAITNAKEAANAGTR